MFQFFLGSPESHESCLEGLETDSGLAALSAQAAEGREGRKCDSVAQGASLGQGPVFASAFRWIVPAGRKVSFLVRYQCLRQVVLAVSINMAGADLESVFRKLCIQFQVTESNYLLMVEGGISTASEMAHRLDKDSLEEILEHRVRLYNAWREEGRTDREDIVVWAKDEDDDPAVPWAEFKTGQEAGAIRRLFSQCQLLSQAAAKKELGEGAAPKVTSMEMVELTSTAVCIG